MAIVIEARVGLMNGAQGAYKPAQATNGGRAGLPHRVRPKSACAPMAEVGR